jgi:hypothetical protein
VEGGTETVNARALTTRVRLHGQAAGVCVRTRVSSRSSTHTHTHTHTLCVHALHAFPPPHSPTLLTANTHRTTPHAHARNRSLLAQTYTNWEWVIWDDSPPGHDETWAVLGALRDADPRVVVMRTDRNDGFIGSVKVCCVLVHVCVCVCRHCVPQQAHGAALQCSTPRFSCSSGDHHRAPHHTCPHGLTANTPKQPAARAAAYRAQPKPSHPGQLHQELGPRTRTTTRCDTAHAHNATHTHTHTHGRRTLSRACRGATHRHNHMFHTTAVARVPCGLWPAAD